MFFPASGQGKLTGTVLSINNRPVGGVNVLLKGTGIATATDMNGRFRLDVPSGPVILFFSFLKRKGLEHPVNVRAGYRYEVYVTLSERTQTFHKSYAVTGELPMDAREIDGRVVDQDGASLAGVSIIIENTVFRSNTDVNGYFSIPIPGDDFTLIISAPGFKNLILPAPAAENDRYALKVVLVEDRTKYRSMKSFAATVDSDELGTDN